MCPSLVCPFTDNMLSAENLSGHETGQEYEALAKLCRGLEGRNVYLSVPRHRSAFRGQWLVDL